MVVAKFLARRIFACVDTGVEIDRAQRIAFKGGRYPDHETDLGGLQESALAKVIWDALLELPPGYRIKAK